MKFTHIRSVIENSSSDEFAAVKLTKLTKLMVAYDDTKARLDRSHQLFQDLKTAYDDLDTRYGSLRKAYDDLGDSGTAASNTIVADDSACPWPDIVEWADAESEDDQGETINNQQLVSHSVFEALRLAIVAGKPTLSRGPG